MSFVDSCPIQFFFYSKRKFEINFQVWHLKNITSHIKKIMFLFYYFAFEFEFLKQKKSGDKPWC